MGGGRTRKLEVPKRLRREPTPLDGDTSGVEGEVAPGGAMKAKVDLELPICEQPQTIALRLEQLTEIGTAVRLVRGNPPVLVAGAKPVGVLSDPRQAALLTACLDDGYAVAGEIVALDQETGEALAAVVGVRSG
jgi:hypothetical protein